MPFAIARNDITKMAGGYVAITPAYQLDAKYVIHTLVPVWDGDSYEEKFDRDRISGSIYGLEGDTIGGFNTMIARQKNGEGGAIVSTVLFDHETEVVHERANIQKIEPLTDREYYVRGCTALLDAVGSAIYHIGNVHKYAREEDRPRDPLFVDRLKMMIQRKKEKYRWEVIFLDTNIDTVKEAARFDINTDCAADYYADSKGTAVIHEAMSEVICNVRTCKPRAADWKQKMDEDIQKRGK